MTFRQPSRPAALLDARACPLCGAASSSAPIVIDRPDFQWFTDDCAVRVPLTDRICASCGLLYRSPILSPAGFQRLDQVIGPSYGNDYHRGQAAWCVAPRAGPWVASQARPLGVPAPLIGPEHRVFDVGCGSGAFLASLPEGVNCGGMDAHPASLALARAQCPMADLTELSVEALTEECWALPSGPHVLTLFHVLEHVADPLGLLRALRRMASKECVLVVEVPVLERGSVIDVTSFFAPQHVTHFTIPTLHRMLARAGWQPREHDACLETDYNGYRVACDPGGVCPTRVPPEPSQARQAVNTYLAAHYTHLGAMSRRVRHALTASRVVVWGAGLHTESLYHATAILHGPLQQWVLVDSDPAKQGQQWRGLDIHAPTRLSSLDWRETQLLISSFGSEAAMVDAAMALGVPRDRIVRLYD